MKAIISTKSSGLQIKESKIIERENNDDGKYEI